MKVELTTGELDLLIESLAYGIRNRQAYAGEGRYPKGYDWEQNGIVPLRELRAKLAKSRDGQEVYDGN